MALELKDLVQAARNYFGLAEDATASDAHDALIQGSLPKGLEEKVLESAKAKAGEAFEELTTQVSDATGKLDTIQTAITTIEDGLKTVTENLESLKTQVETNASEAFSADDLKPLEEKVKSLGGDVAKVQAAVGQKPNAGDAPPATPTTNNGGGSTEVEVIETPILEQILSGRKAQVKQN